jgi:hypothetical protein
MEAQRIWSKKILKVVDVYLKRKNLILFAATGDLDNLGIFVSRYGRPQAENLVDFYNHLIGATMYKFIQMHKLEFPAFCMIPSGEEIFVIGVAKSEKIIKKFFSLLCVRMNMIIRADVPVHYKDVAISFGCKIFQDKKLDQQLTRFVNLAKTQFIKRASMVYLKVMLIIRNELSYELDKAKFRSLGMEEKNLVVFFRNIIYVKLQEYKINTKRTLVAFAKKLNHDEQFFEKLQTTELNQKYGISNKNKVVINKILQNKKAKEL